MDFLRKWRFFGVVCLIVLSGVVFAAEEKKQEGIRFEVSEESSTVDKPECNGSSPTHLAVLKISNLPPIDPSGVLERLEEIKVTTKRTTADGKVKIKTSVDKRAEIIRRTRIKRSLENSVGDDWQEFKFKGNQVEVYGDEFIKNVLESESGKKLGRKTRDLIKCNGYKLIFNPTTPMLSHFLVYGYGEDDVKLAVKALIEAFEVHAAEAREKFSSEIAEINAKMEKSQKKYDKKSSELDEIRKKLAKAKEESHYPSVDELQERILTVNSLIEEKKIELSGHNAKIEEIDISSETTMRNAKIERAQVRGEYEAAVRLREKLEDYAGLYITLGNKEGSAGEDLRSCGKRLAEAKQNKHRFNKLLNKEESERFKPLVRDAVEIYTIETKTK